MLRKNAQHKYALPPDCLVQDNMSGLAKSYIYSFFHYYSNVFMALDEWEGLRRRELGIMYSSLSPIFMIIGIG